jgi:coproporphyrinogen III oxidase-like Fe-S oxidoreductase
VHERILLGLRSGGLDLARLSADLAYDLPHRQERMMRWLIEEGLALQDEQRLRLTRKGSMLCDEISIRLARDVSL